MAVILDRGLRKDLNIGLGDILAVRVQKPYAVFCVWPAATAVRLNEVDASLLPPRSPREVTRA